MHTSPHAGLMGLASENHGSCCSASRNGVFTNAGARQIYSAAIAFPQGSNVLMCSTAALTEKSGLPSPLKLLSSAVQMTASRCLSLAQVAIIGQGDEEESVGRRILRMFLSVVPSRHRRSQIVSSMRCRLLRHHATVVSTPFLLSITSVKAPCRVVDILENSTLRVGPSKRQFFSCCSSNSGLTSHMREPQARIAISGFPSFIRTLPKRRTRSFAFGSMKRAASHRQHSWTIHGPNCPAQPIFSNVSRIVSSSLYSLPISSYWSLSFRPNSTMLLFQLSAYIEVLLVWLAALASRHT